MAVVHAPVQGRLPAGTRGIWYYRRWRGLVIAQTCPNFRRYDRSPRLLEQIEHFRAIVATTKYVDPTLQREMMQACQGTPILWRDMLHAMLSGTLIGAPIVDGRRLYPMSYVKKVARSLDALRPRAPGILARDRDIWRVVRCGPTGTVLTSRGPNRVPTWA